MTLILNLNFFLIFSISVVSTPIQPILPFIRLGTGFRVHYPPRFAKADLTGGENVFWTPTGFLPMDHDYNDEP